MYILLIEDEPKTAQVISAFLEANHAKVDCCTNGVEGLRHSLQNNYDVIVSDVIMPGMNGIDLSKALREQGKPTPLLLLSALSQPEDKVTGLNAGADDYLAKPFDLQELWARLQALVRRHNQKTFSSNKLSYTDLEINCDSHEVWRAGTKISLTPREFALLQYLMRHQGRVISKMEILENVWNIDVEINTNVIEVYVNYIRSKIDKGFSPKLIHTHFGTGYIISTEPPR
jgi:two-component system, OmpR family, copper resistance phosphate regulon response regulator CusR